MAGTLTNATANVSVGWTFTEDLSISTSVNAGDRSLSQSFSNGTEAQQANKVFVKKGSINPSSSETLNLQSQADFFAAALSFDLIRYLYFELTAESACSSVLVGGAGVANPTTAPSLSAIAGGLTAGTYRVAYTWKNAAGETMISPVSSQVVNGSQDIRVAALTLPSGATDIYYYCSFASTGLALGYQGTGTGAAYDITSLPATNAAAVPQSNSTGTGVTSLFGNAFDQIRVRNGGAWFIMAPKDSAGYSLSTTLKNLKITNEDSTYPAQYVLIVVGSDT